MASSLIKYQLTIKSLFANRIWWLAIASIVGFVIYFQYDSKVFPSASIGLKVPRIEIIRKARELAFALGYEPSKAIESTQFTVDNQAKTFLE